MKTRWMIKVESKIKDAPRGAPFILFSCALVPVMYWLKWNVKWTVTRSEWSLNSSTLRLIFWVYSKTQAASRDIPLLLINTNNPHDLFSTWMIDTYELEHHSRLVQHMAESWIPSPTDIYERVQYIRTISSTWMVDSHDTHKLEHHSRLVQHMAESWIPSPIDIYERVRYIRTSSIYMNDFKHMNGWFSTWWLSPGFLPQSIYTNYFDIYERWLSPGLLPQSFDLRFTWFQFNGLLLQR